MNQVSDLVDRIQMLFDLKKYQLAIDLFNNEPSLMEEPYALYHVGRAYVRLQKTDHAIALFKIALQLNPYFSESKLELAKCCIKSTPNKAEQLVQQCMQSNPSDPAYWGVLGSIFFYAKDFLEAEIAFNKCLSLGPNDPRTMSNLAACKNKLGKLEEAFDYCKKAVALDPSYANAHINLAFSYLETGNTKDAEETFFVAMKLSPNNHYVFYGLAEVYTLNQQTEKALHFLEQSIDFNVANKSAALENKNFKGLLKHPQFIQLTQSGNQTEGKKNNTN